MHTPIPPAASPPDQTVTRVSGGAQPWPLHDTAATRALEARALALAAPHAVMERAGVSAARLLLALQPHARHIAVLAGPGNNGGDGLVAARHLHRLGLDVRVLHLAASTRQPSDAAHASAQARSEGLRFVAGTNELTQADVVIDALLGLGSHREPEGAIAEAVHWANAWSGTDAAAHAPAHGGAGTHRPDKPGKPILALDLPSGLHADTGARLGAACIKARWTLSLLTLKPGLFTAEGRDLAGDIWLDTLGSFEPSTATAWLGPASAPPTPGLATRLHAQHKGSFGDVLVVGGAAGMQGAVWLAARAALTAGAGRVYACPLSPGSTAPWPEVMMRDPAWTNRDAGLQRCTVVCGCGGGQTVAEALPAVLAQAPRLVLDADALNRVAEQTELQQMLTQRASAGQTTVLTPHPLEAARLLGVDVVAVQRDRLAAAQALAHQWNTVVVLKGSGTVVTSPNQAPWINANGNARLATPGSGDVLGGWLGGVWAQSAQHGSPLDSALHAARLAVWLHGRAAENGSPPAGPLRALDLIDAMAASAARG